MTRVSIKGEIKIVANPNELSRVAAEEFVRQAREAIQVRGFFTVVLSGGSTPRGLYALLAADSYREQVLWSKVHLFWGDERCVPPAHPDSNYHMAYESLLNKVPIPGKNIHRMQAEQGDRGRAAEEYEQMLKVFFRLEVGEFPRFDLILLGMGEDGHTASLFPGTAVLEETARFVAVSYIEKFSAYRLTLTVPVINRAANVIFLISGGSKATVLKEVIEGKYYPQRLPSQLIRPVDGRLLFIVDSAAASKLKGFVARYNS